MCWDFHISTSVLEHDGLKKKKTILLNISTCIITKRDTVNKTNDIVFQALTIFGHHSMASGKRFL